MNSNRQGAVKNTEEEFIPTQEEINYVLEAVRANPMLANFQSFKKVLDYIARHPIANGGRRKTRRTTKKRKTMKRKHYRK